MLFRSPRNPYSASKAGADRMAFSYFTTYGLPVMITRCSNNFGPYQYPEKLIPLFITNLLEGEKVPLYGDGKNIRDWIYVEDHCQGIELAIKKGKIGEKYCFGGDAERQNIDIAKQICLILDRIKPRADKKSYQEQIKFVEDRKGHDFRYAIDSTKAKIGRAHV